MIQRTLLRQSSRALSSSLRTSASRQATRSQFRSNTPLIAQAASRQFQGRRWYATEPEAKKDETEGEKKEGEEKSDSKQEVEDPVKKELEAKNREIIDLKVCFLGFLPLLFHHRGVFRNPASSMLFYNSVVAELERRLPDYREFKRS
jgi:molecular chaperone GrpE